MEYWYLYLLLAVLIVAAVFVWRKALLAAAKRKKINDEELARLKREKELREAYSDLTEEKIASSPAEELFNGIALCLEHRFQKVSDLNSAFDELNTEQQNVYALYYLAQDDSAACFFRSGTQPLTGAGLRAIGEVFGEKAYAAAMPLFRMFDDADETVSADTAEASRLDTVFKESFLHNGNFCVKVGNYIKSNAEKFI